MTPSSSHPYNCQDFILLLFLNLSETFAVNEEVTAFQEVTLKGKSEKQLSDSNLNQIRWGTGPFRIRSLFIYLKQVSLHSLKLFSQDVFIQKWRFQNTFLRYEQSLVHGFPFPLRGQHRLGCPQGKDDQMFSSVQLCHFQVSPPLQLTLASRNLHKKLCSRSDLNGYQPISVSPSSKTEVKHGHMPRKSRRYFRSEELEENWSSLMHCRWSPELGSSFFFFSCGWLIRIYGNFNLFQMQ